MNTEIFTVQEDQASNFLEQFLSGEKVEIQEQQKPIAEVNTEAITDNEEEKESVQEGDTDEKVQELLKNKEEEEKKVKEDIPQVLFDKLHEQGLIFPYEDGSKPESIEEITDALKQSYEVSINEKISQAWEQKINSLSPSIQTIIKYAESGVATATEVNSLIQNVSHYEKVNDFDVTNPADQEQIVYLHLVNTGLSEQEAIDQIEIFKENKTLEKSAQKFHPSLKKMYENQIRQEFSEKQAKEEDLGRYIDTNALNVSYFLKKEDTYLPFKISDNHKAAVLELAAKPLGVGENYEPIFAYQEYLKQLQNGSEDQYKEFMEIMTFIADRNSFKKKLSSVVSSKTNKENFKKIAVGEGRTTNKDSQQEQYQGPVIRKQSGSPWSI
jgi:hypothetical protein